MARAKNAVVGEGIPQGGEAASTPSSAADDPCTTFFPVSDMDGERNLSALRGQQHANMHLFKDGCLFGQICQKAVSWPPRAPNSVTVKCGKKPSES
jgi:hypothetical protein